MRSWPTLSGWRAAPSRTKVRISLTAAALLVGGFAWWVRETQPEHHVSTNAATSAPGDHAQRPPVFTPSKAEPVAPGDAREAEPQTVNMPAQPPEAEATNASAANPPSAHAGGAAAQRATSAAAAQGREQPRGPGGSKATPRGPDDSRAVASKVQTGPRGSNDAHPPAANPQAAATDARATAARPAAAQRDQNAADPARRAPSPAEGSANAAPVSNDNPYRRNDPAADGGGSEPGYLSLDTAPWSEVFLGQTLLGTTPIIKVPLPPGRHLLTLKNSELAASASYVVEIKSGKTVSRLIGWAQ